VSENFDFSAAYLAERQLVIDWLCEHNFPPLPVAPAFDPRQYPKVVSPAPASGSGNYCSLNADLQPIPLFTGKNPSYLDGQGRPHLVVHSNYQKRMPTPCELRSWFENPLTGVGTLGGWNNTVWLDFDQKRFHAGTSIDDSVLRVVDLIRQRTGNEPFLERTHSGGWRIGIALRNNPTFTNFAVSPDGSHVGEALFKGRFTVLAPTVGPSGSPYRSLNRPAQLPLLDSLESIGIFPASKSQNGSLLAQPSLVSASLPSSEAPASGSLSLTNLLCPKSRSILDGANIYDDRSRSLTTLINEVFGWHNWLCHNSLPVSDDPMQLVSQSGSLLGIDPARVGRIFTSAGDLSSKQPAAFYLGGDQSCWKKIYRLDRSLFKRFCPPDLQVAVRSDFSLNPKVPNASQSFPPAQASVGVSSPDHPAVSDQSSADSLPARRQTKLVDRIKSLILTYDNEARATEALMELAVSVGKPYSEISHLARFVRAEIESFQELRVAISSLRPLLSHCRKRLDIRRYLVPTLADALIEAAGAMPTAPEYLLNTLIPVAASRIGTSARVVVNPHAGYVQPCIFWTANVANSGQAKTPPQSLIVDPLEDLEQEDRDRYQNELLAWQTSTDKNKGPKPIETRRILNNITTAQKIRVHSENPRGLLDYQDELTGDFERLNQFSRGQGDDLRHELAFFNGRFGSYDRGDVRLYLRRVAFNKTGTYQWDTLARLMSDQVDFISSGYLARFLLCSIVDAPERRLDLFAEPSEGDCLFFLLRNLYRSLEILPPQDYLLSREAKILFQAFNHSLVAAEVQESHFGLDLVYAKIESYAARLALWLHIVNAVVQGQQPGPVISGGTMQAAIELAAFYLWQHKLIYAHNAPTQKLDGIFLKVHTCALKLWSKGKALTSSFAKSRVNSIKGWTTAKIRDKIFRVLALAGFGRVEGQGEKLVYIPNQSSPTPAPDRDDIFTLGGVGGVGAGLATPSSPESLCVQAVPSTVGADSLLVPSHPSISSLAPPGSPLGLSPEPVVSSQVALSSTSEPSTSLANCSQSLTDVVSSSPAQITNLTDVAPQVVLLPESQAVEKPPTPPPTVAQLRATLLACSTLTGTGFSQLLRLRASHEDVYKQAYDSITPEEQSRFDGFLAGSYTEPVYKYLGSDSVQPQAFSLCRGDLVRLKDSKLRPNLTWVLPLHAPAVLADLQPPQFLGVNPKCLELVPKLSPPSSVEQMTFL
jgi:hypothetical protein